MVYIVASPAGGVDWTMLGVLFTAVFTGGIVIYAALGYKLGRDELRASQRTLHKLPMVDLTHHWMAADGAPHLLGTQIRLVLENKHPNDPIRFEITYTNLEAVAADASTRLGLPVDGGTGGGVVSPGMQNHFTLAPIPPVGQAGWSVGSATNPVPPYLYVTFTIRYGAVRHHREFEFEWRETRNLMAVLSQPPDPSLGSKSIPYTWKGIPESERLTAPTRFERLTRRSP